MALEGGGRRTAGTKGAQKASGQVWQIRNSPRLAPGTFACAISPTCPSLSLEDIMADQIWKEYFILWMDTR